MNKVFLIALCHDCQLETTGQVNSLTSWRAWSFQILIGFKNHEHLPKEIDTLIKLPEEVISGKVRNVGSGFPVELILDHMAMILGWSQFLPS